MKIDILTLFPEMFEGPFQESIIKRAQENEFVDINIHNLRDWATDKHNKVDDKPYGGGPGMVIKVDVVDEALRSLKDRHPEGSFEIEGSQDERRDSSVSPQIDESKVILLSPQGKVYNQQKAQELAKEQHLILIAGHYEGFDQRIRDHLIDQEISIGNYVLTGGELPAMVVTDSVVRLIPGVLGTEESLADETHSQLTESRSRKTNIKYPVYTRPEEYKDWKVPDILLSGNHPEIDKWRNEKSKKIET